jgi:surfeit locus 1 family protein
MVLLIPVFCGLGVWQLDRAEQKRQLAASLESRRKLPASSLNSGTQSPNELEFSKINADGHFLTQKTILIENRKHRGKTGFHVITPFLLEGTQQVVLVNRGWIPRQQLDQPDPVPTPAGTLRISGLVTLPQPPALELQFTDAKDQGLPRWPYLTLDHFARWSGLEVLPFAVLQSPDDSGGFVREWPQPKFSDTMHIGYAIQWFAFALICFVIWLRLSMPKQTMQETTP